MCAPTKEISPGDLKNLTASNAPTPQDPCSTFAPCPAVPWRHQVKGVEKDEGGICVSGQCEPVPAPQRVTGKLAGMDLDWNQHVATAITTA